MERRHSDPNKHSKMEKVEKWFARLGLGDKKPENDPDHSSLPPRPPPGIAAAGYPPHSFIGGFRPENGGVYPAAAQPPPGVYGSSPPPPFTGQYAAVPPPGHLHTPPPPPPPSGPMRMPEPLYAGPSLTTQYALQHYHDPSLPNLPQPPSLRPPAPDTPVRPHSDTDIKRPGAGGKSSSPGKRPGASPPVTPKKDQDALSVSSDARGRRKSSPGAISGTVTCSGTTKSGEPCKNFVKRPTALGHVDSDADEEIERYCHLHLKEVLKPSGFQSSKANEWVDYDGEYASLRACSSLTHSQTGYPRTSRRIRRQRCALR